MSGMGQPPGSGSDITLVQAEQSRNTLLGQLDADLKAIKLALQTIVYTQPNLRIMGNISGIPGDGSLEANWLFNLAMMSGDQLVATLSSGWKLVGAVAATGSAAFTLKKNGVSIGTATVSAGQTQATWSFAANVAFADFDRLSFVPPSPPDATLSDVAWTIVGVRTQ